jgi:hypothetical protein
MKGQQVPPPQPIIITPGGGHYCDLCQKPISLAEWQRNTFNNKHYCDNCIVTVKLTRQPRAGGLPRTILCWPCQNMVNLDDPNVTKEGDPIQGYTYICPNCRYRIKPMHCPNCREFIDRNAPNCDHCQWVNKSHVKTAKSLKETTGKKLNVAKIYELLIYEIAGIFVIFGLPFLGFPSMIYLGIVLMALFPFYSFLPSEHETLASRETGVESLGAWAAGSLLLKGIVKLFAFILTVFQFIILPVSKLIPLAISFVYYFRLPISYKVTQPFQMIEAWFRVGVGILIAWFMLMAFAGTPQAWSLTLMSAAFFVTSFPRHKEAEEEKGVVRIDILDKAGLKYLKGQLELPLKFLFLILMIAAWAVSGIGFGTSSIQIIFIAVWALSFFSGWVAGSEGRPALGILMIGITLFVFTFTATGVMGQAVFGYWWPQIEAFGEAIAAPLAPMWEQVQSGIGDAWLMMTNPMAYIDIMNKKGQATKSVVKEGGTTKSIELLKTDLFTSVPGELEPILDPLIGSFEIQNQGEFDANWIELKLWTSWQDPAKTTMSGTPNPAIPTGTFYTFKCSTGSTPSSPIGTCNWDQNTYPKEIRNVNFMFDKNSWDLNGDNLNICVLNGTDQPDCSDSAATYKHSGQTVKVNVNLTYDYNVNVSIPVEVINFSAYQNLLQAKEITLQELTSQYTGGPVKATLWSQRQPIRAGESSLFVASVYNDGGGEMSKINSFKVRIPEKLGTVEKISSNFYLGGTSVDGCGPNGVITPSNGYVEITCSHDWANHPVKSGEYKRVSFLVTPPQEIGVDRISRLIIGLASYTYIKTSSKTITVANNPLH